MNRIKLFLTSLLASVFALGAVAAATPSNGWRVNISTPANTTSKTFNVEYTTLSINSADHITVELFQNGGSVGSQTTTKPYGDSGVFTITVPSTGTYSYFIKATNTGDPTPKNTSTVTVNVSDAPQGSTTTINTGTTGGGGGAGAGGAGGGGAGAAGGAAGTAATTTGQPAGQVGAGPATTGGVTQDDANVLGEQTQNQQQGGNNNDGTNWPLAIAILAALAGAGFGGYRYYLIRRDAN